jgi:hypothetical protein
MTYAALKATSRRQRLDQDNPLLYRIGPQKAHRISPQGVAKGAPDGFAQLKLRLEPAARKRVQFREPIT